MTKKSGVLFFVAAYLAMGSTAGFAHKHHHPTQDNQNKADIAATQCFKECDAKRMLAIILENQETQRSKPFV